MKNKIAKLVEEFPELYYNMPCGFGIECGPGWYDLLRELSIKIRNWLKDHPNDSITVEQVKEKYGELRYYYSLNGDEFDKALALWVLEAEELSIITCEDCGKPGERYHDGWKYTRCEECLKEQGRIITIYGSN